MSFKLINLTFFVITSLSVYYGLICDEFNKTGKVDYEKFPPKLAITMELCAGIVDKNISLADIAREELIEECGYNVPVER